MSRAVDTFVQILWKQFTHSFSFKSPVSLPFDFVSFAIQRRISPPAFLFPVFTP